MLTRSIMRSQKTLVMVYHGFRESQFYAAVDMTHGMHTRSTVRRQYSDRTW